MEKTDAVVIFTGEIQREKTAWYLYRQGLAKKLHISGRHPGNYTYSTNISVDFACNTYTNVALTGQWIRDHGLKSIRLVTSDYHMPRCLVLVHHFWPNIHVVAHPIPMHDKKKITNIWAEYIRYLRAILLCCIGI